MSRRKGERQKPCIQLTEKDEYIPDTHIGMYSLFRNPKNSSVYMGEDYCQSIRQKTFQNTFELYKKYGSPDFADFFNYNVEVLGEIGRNYFCSVKNLGPLCDFVECFTKDAVRANMHQVKYSLVSFGIEKNLVVFYLLCQKEGKDFYEELPEEYYRKKLNYGINRDLIIFGKRDIRCDGRKTFSVEINPIYRRFEDWCEIRGVEKSDGLLMALETLMEAYPESMLKKTSEYDFITELDAPVFAKPKSKAKKYKRTVTFSGKIAALADKIIERYNRDADNRLKQIDFDDYCNNAIYLLNQNMDLMYRDPDLYIEKVKTEEMERMYNGEGRKKGSDQQE